MKLPKLDVYKSLPNGFELRTPNKKVTIEGLKPGDVLFPYEHDAITYNLDKIDIVMKITVLTLTSYKINSISLLRYTAMLEEGHTEIDYIDLDTYENVYIGTNDPSVLYSIYRVSIKEILEKI